MPEARDHAGHFEPIHAAHAIEQATFAISFAEEVDEKAYDGIRKVGENFKSDFPGQRAVNGLQFMVGGSGVAPRRMEGVQLQKTRADGTVENELRCDRSSVTFRTAYYTRWSELLGRIQTYLAAYLPYYAESGALSEVSLQFVDKFVWHGEMKDCRPGLLLRKESKFLCPHMMTATDLWHSHCGIFEWPDKDTKRLLAVNVDCIDENLLTGLRRSIAITSSLKDMPNQGIQGTVKFDLEACVREIGERFSKLHALDKEILSDLLLEEMSRRIALKVT